MVRDTREKRIDKRLNVKYKAIFPFLSCKYFKIVENRFMKC